MLHPEPTQGATFLYTTLYKRWCEVDCLGKQILRSPPKMQFNVCVSGVG